MHLRVVDKSFFPGANSELQLSNTLLDHVGRCAIRIADLLKTIQDEGVCNSVRYFGGHLWIFFEKPALARDCRVYIYHTALRLGLPIKGAGLPEGIEIFPRQDEIGPDEFGNAIRAPLGVHRGAKESRGWRFWFYNADYTLTDQFMAPANFLAINTSFFFDFTSYACANSVVVGSGGFTGGGGGVPEPSTLLLCVPALLLLGFRLIRSKA